MGSGQERWTEYPVEWSLQMYNYGMHSYIPRMQPIFWAIRYKQGLWLES